MFSLAHGASGMGKFLPTLFIRLSVRCLVSLMPLGDGMWSRLEFRDGKVIQTSSSTLRTGRPFVGELDFFDED